RRHTRLVSDWSSDVCSSDLLRYVAQVRQRDRRAAPITNLPTDRQAVLVQPSRRGVVRLVVGDPAEIVQNQRFACAIAQLSTDGRSEERRVGKGGGSRRGEDV